MPTNETIRVSIRVRPVTSAELARYPGPLPVQAAPGEVRVYTNPPAALHLAKGNRDQASSATSASAAKRSGSAPAAPPPSGPYQGYPFSAVFGPDASNDQVYVESGCQKVVASVCQGCNGTVFVYGQTGAGKTFSCDALTAAAVQQVFDYGASCSSDGGAESLHSTGCSTASSITGNAAGAPPPMDVQVSVCVLELYNEVLRCLLSGKEVVLMMGPGGLLLDGATEQSCSSSVALLAALASGKANRVVGETRANARSSRSHLIIRIRVQALQAGPPSSCSSSSNPAEATGGSCCCSCGVLNLVDLAGSERVDKTGSADSSTRLREALNINKSLLCLGNVVTALADGADGRKVHVPYRDSKLTRLLEDSLGGSARTALLACITPLPDWHLELTKATLSFAARAARIVCRPQRNVVVLPTGPGGLEQQELVEALQAEVAALRAQLAAAAAAAAAAQQHAAVTARMSRANSGEISSSLSPRSGSFTKQQQQQQTVEAAGEQPLDGSSRGSSPEGRASRSNMLWRLLAAPRLQGASASQRQLYSTTGSTGSLEDRFASDISTSGSTQLGDSLSSDSSRAFGLQKRWATFAVRKTRKGIYTSVDGLGPLSSTMPLPSTSDVGSSNWGDHLEITLPSSRLHATMDGSMLDGGDPRRQWSSGGGATDEGGRPVADSLVPQLLGVLAAKKAELAALQQQLAAMTAQLQQATADKERQDRQLCELAAGLSALSTARQSERRQWGAQLEALESGLAASRSEVEQHKSVAADLRQQLRGFIVTRQSGGGAVERPDASGSSLPPAAAADLALLLTSVLQAHPAWLSSLPLRLDLDTLQQLLAGAHQHCPAVPSHPLRLDASSPAPGSGASTPRGNGLLDSNPGSIAVSAPAPCKKCEATKPLLAFLHKLKEQVVLLGKQLAAKEAELAAQRTTVAQLRAQLAAVGAAGGESSNLGKPGTAMPLSTPSRLAVQ